MVRFKNRYLLVEFLVPSAFSSTLQSRLGAPTPAIPDLPNGHHDDDDQSDSDDEDELLPIPQLPFLLPLTGSPLKLGEDGANVIYKAVRGVITDVFGDEGWGRVASSFRVLYHSPLTTLTFIRIARSHYRLLWSAFTFLTTLGSVGVIPRVVAVSGTIRKLQNRGVTYHRAVVARMIAAAQEDSTGTARGISVGAGAKSTEKDAERERGEISRLADA